MVPSGVFLPVEYVTVPYIHPNLLYEWKMKFVSVISVSKICRDNVLEILFSYNIVISK